MNPQIFREYDIRGVADTDLTSEVVEAIGKAYGTQLKHAKKKVVTVGHDCRVSSKRIEKALVDGITSTGMDVKRLGLVTTPALYYSIHHLKVDGGIMVTGSHNPPDHNGLKICVGTTSMHGSEIQGLYKMMQLGTFLEGKGKASSVKILDKYIDEIVSQIKLKKKLSIIIDCANGMAGVVAPEVFKKLGCKTEEMYTELDGTFPNHPADPTVPKNLEELIGKVKKSKVDLGLSFDGDGDRVGVVDNEGNIVFGDRLMILLAREVLSRKKGATIIGDVKCSNLMYEDIEAHGGKAIMWKTGHSLIKAKMKETDSELAGEMSGHIFYQDRWFGFDSGVYTACRLLEIVANSDKSLSEMLSEIPQTFATPEIRRECSDDRKFELVKEATESFKRQGLNVNDIDGARVTFEDGWGLIRASNTQPVVVMRFEANTEKRLEEIRRTIEDRVNELLEKIK